MRLAFWRAGKDKASPDAAVGGPKTVPKPEAAAAYKPGRRTRPAISICARSVRR